MAFLQTHQMLQLLVLVSLVCFTMAARQVPKTSQGDQNMLFQYHNGALLSGKFFVNLIWYGKFTPSERAIMVDFISSLSSPSNPTTTKEPSVATWWKAIEKYNQMVKSKRALPLRLSLGTQILDEGCSLGKSLTEKQIEQLAAKGSQKNAINIVLTAADVTVDRFCSSTCGTHGTLLSSKTTSVKGKVYKFAFIWVGNSATQCPGQCAWPFYKPIYGPQNPPLVSPNNNVGMDGMIINVATLMAGTVTNPFGNGFFQGPASAPLEAASACQGIYGSGAYPGNAGKLLVEPATGASYNAYGTNERKYLLPALVDPTTSACSTLV